MRSAQTQIDATAAQIAQARAQLEAARASLRQAQLDVNDTTLYSSIAGRVGDRSVRVGQYVQPGTRLLTVVPVQSLYLEANFKETELTKMRIGQPAEIEVDTYPGVKWRAHVASIAPASGAEFSVLPPQNATGNWVKIVQRIPVRLELDETQPADAPPLRAGMSAEVKVDLRDDTAAHRATASR